jgi:transcription elongation GreA/GreB family factor
MTSGQHVSISRQAYIRLKDELATLRSWPSIEVPDDLMDTHENRKRYRARRTRIHQIEDLLADAIIEDDSAGRDIAEPGMLLTVRYDDTGAIDRFILGGHGACDTDNKIYPLRSSIGRALAGAVPGEHRLFSLPDGAETAVTLLSANAAATSVAKSHQSECDSLRRTGRQGRPRQRNSLDGVTQKRPQMSSHSRPHVYSSR